MTKWNLKYPGDFARWYEFRKTWLEKLGASIIGPNPVEPEQYPCILIEDYPRAWDYVYEDDFNFAYMKE